MGIDDVLKIEMHDMEFHSDYNTDCGGMGFEWKCPDCGEKITWAPGMWWSMECCRKWSVTIHAEGEKR